MSALTMDGGRVGGGVPVEAPDDHLWHIRVGATTLCDRQASDWPIIFGAVSRGGMWCSWCLRNASRVGPEPS